MTVVSATSVTQVLRYSFSGQRLRGCCAHLSRPRQNRHFPCCKYHSHKATLLRRHSRGFMLTGYARVSTDDQDLRLQRASLKEAGCKRVYEEKISGARRDRPQLVRMLDQVREDDVVVVTRLDRLARSTRDLLDVAEQLKEAGAGLRSLGEPWADTTSPAGRMVLTVFAGIAEFERALINQRTSSGRVAAMQRGVRFGRPAKLEPDQVALAHRLVGEGTPVRAIARMLNVHAATVYRAIAAFPSDEAEPSVRA